jgi:tRNA-specific 2-thiouridylase
MLGKNKKVLAAMSGGVDSSVAAFLLREQGYDVIGVSMNLYSCSRPSSKSCCTAQDRLHAQEVCAKLGVPFITVDYRNLFKETVIRPFVGGYLSGRTPSPCILCNKYLKFGALFEEMKRLGASYVATGHYARVERYADGTYGLLRGVDFKKDQSYFLFSLGQDELSKVIFPLGSLTKDKVKKIAAERGLLRPQKKESQEICFIADGDVASFVETQCPENVRGPGNFVDKEGRVLGRHRGIHAYTIGQRRGLGFGMGRRQFVVRIDPGKNEVCLGSNMDLLREEMTLSDVHMTLPGRTFSRDAHVKIRSVHKPAEAQIFAIGDGRLRVKFLTPQRAVTPGQAAVLYDGDRVIGGGWID